MIVELKVANLIFKPLGITFYINRHLDGYYVEFEGNIFKDEKLDDLCQEIISYLNDSRNYLLSEKDDLNDES